MKKLTPLQSVRKKCLSCCETSTDVRRCIFDGKQDVLCVLHPYRMGVGRVKLKDIRKYCVEDCCLGSRREVLLCETEKCPLWGYRMGHRPILPPPCSIEA